MAAPGSAPNNILVIKLGALGDVVQALGPMAAIRRHHAADRITALGREAKNHIELDRAQAAREAGYEVLTLSLVRGDDAPPNKNHLLVGAPRGDRAKWLRNFTPGNRRGE